MNQPLGYIYLIKDHFTNKIYIGQSHRLDNQNLNDYFGSGIIIEKIIKKRKHHLSKTILGYCQSQQELDDAEETCINFFSSNNKYYGYNILSKSCGVGFYQHQHSKHSKKLIKLKRKKQICSLETRLKMSSSRRGKKSSRDVKGTHNPKYRHDIDNKVLFEDFLSGKSINDLAIKYSCHRKTIRTRLKFYR